MKYDKWMVCAGIIAVMVLTQIIVRTSVPVSPGFTRANFERIGVGMTYDEVKQIFGREADEAFLFPCQWSDGAGVMVFISFNEENRVVNKSSWPIGETWIQKVQRLVLGR